MKLIFSRVIKIILVIIVFTGAYQWGRPFPDSLEFPNSEYFVPDQSVRFFADYTYLDDKGVRQTEQNIWNEAFTLINGAKYYMLFDFFLFNDFQSVAQETSRPVGREFTDTVTNRMKNDGHIAAVLITDPINTVYGGIESKYLTALRSSGVHILETNLNILKDSNLLWSALWRPFFSWTGNDTMGGLFPHPFDADGEKVTLRSWASLLNFKANHRKIFVLDQTEIINKKPVEKMVTFVTSSNPHDASGAHGNVALEIRDGIWRDVIENEHRIAGLSGEDLASFDTSRILDDTGPISVKLLTETHIRDTVLALITNSKRDDSFDLAMFYLSERKIVNALIDAANRGVKIRIVLDPNKDAFGHMKNGIPNRPIAKELIKDSATSIEIRWCNTHGEQCHAKYFAGKTEKKFFMMIGSANFTRRNINGFNLEANVIASSENSFTAWEDGRKYFERIWSNIDGSFTTDYQTYEDDTIWKSSISRMMERTGLSTF